MKKCRLGDLKQVHAPRHPADWLVGDGLDDELQRLARQIVAQTGVTYANWLPDKALTEYMNRQIAGVPTTLFINGKGQILGNAIIAV